MKLVAIGTLSLVFAATAPILAQTSAPFTDPANLRGERVTPLNGRELPVDQGLSGLEQLLRRANTRASLMLIVAHPDDEDGGMLTFYSRGLGANAATMTLTRGEGGQNAMTGDFEDALGLLRTQELLSADRYLGVHQMFGTEVDFGFTKTKEEAFSKWSHERVLYDAVRAVRLFRPLVICAVFIGEVTDGHGQHQVSGEIAQEVFKAAGDPKVFPELTAEGILPWQPLKVFARVPRGAITDKGLFDYATGQYTPVKFTNYVTGEVSATTPSADVVVHEGNTDPLLGPYPAKEPFVSYVQFARQGLGLQKSQVGPGDRRAQPGVFDVSYHLYGSCLANSDSRKYCHLEGQSEAPTPLVKAADDASFFDGIDISLAGIASLAPTAFPELHASLAQIQSDINAATQSLDPNNMQKVAPFLANALKLDDSLIKSVEATRLSREAKENVLHELRVKQVQLNDALAIALSVKVDATVDTADLIENTPVTVHTASTEIPDEEPAKTSIVSTSRPQAPESVPPVATLPPAMLKAETRPYFYRDSIEDPVYKLHDATLRNAPATPAPLTAWTHFTYKGATFTVGRVVHAGNQSAAIVPPVSIMLSNHAQVLPAAEKATTVSMVYKPSTIDPQGEELTAAGWKSEALSATANVPGHIAFRLNPPVDRKPTTAKGSIKLANGTSYTEGYRSVGYGDVARTNYFTPAVDRIVPVDVNLPSKTRIAYLPGTGDEVPEDLASIGLPVVKLAVADLTADKLASFDTVILGVRAYGAHADLHGKPTQALFDFARKGGNVVVQYQTAGFTAEDAPYPVAFGRITETVIDETAPVQLLDPQASLLTTPNAITPADFNGWVEERGHGFLTTWDPHYTALTETHDPGQEPQRGGLLTVQLGKGRWTYVAFALYRQLPEAVPGAFRLFTNLINP